MTDKKSNQRGNGLKKLCSSMSSRSDSRLNHVFAIQKLNIDKIKILKLFSNFQENLKPLDGCRAEPGF